MRMETKMKTEMGRQIESTWPRMKLEKWKRNLIGPNLHLYLEKCEAHRDVGDESRRQQCNIHMYVVRIYRYITLYTYAQLQAGTQACTHTHSNTYTHTHMHIVLPKLKCH